MTHYERAQEQLETAHEFEITQTLRGTGHECDRRIEYAKVEAILAVAEELRLARERKTFILPSGNNVSINLDRIVIANFAGGILFTGDTNGDSIGYRGADAEALAEALGMTKKETE